jgi:hypothetical protein
VTTSEPIKVFIRNAAGDYFGHDGQGWNFLPSRERALQFDYLADDIAAQVAHARRDVGLEWVVWPVDPNLLIETCDLCGRKMHTDNAHFHGTYLLCPSCCGL